MVDLITEIIKIVPQTTIAGGGLYVAKHLFTPSLDYLGEKMKERLMCLFNEGKAHPQMVISLLETLPQTSGEIREMFLQLLSTSLDETKQHLAHPAFPIILKQLCSDEAKIITILNEKSYRDTQVIVVDFDKRETTDSHIEKSEIWNKIEILSFKDNYRFYMNHLHSLGLAGTFYNSKSFSQEHNGDQNKGIRYEYHSLTDFGKLFAQACIPSITSSSLSLA